MTNNMKQGKRIGQGNTAEIFEWGNNHILKLYRHGLSDQLCIHEYEITKFVWNQLKIAPEPIEIVTIEGRIGAVYERLTGDTMLRLLLSKPWKLKYYAKLLAKHHFHIHKKATLDTISVKEKLKRDITHVGSLTEEEKQLLYSYMESLPDGDCLCHFDFHPDNLMISGDKNYVIDWMTACIGDPNSDVARTSLMLNYAEIPRVPWLVKVWIKLFQNRIYKVYIKEYLLVSGANISDIQKWELPLAAARLCEWIPEAESEKLLHMVKQELAKF